LLYDSLLTRVIKIMEDHYLTNTDRVVLPRKGQPALKKGGDKISSWLKQWPGYSWRE